MKGMSTLATEISVVIPVGPYPGNVQWLDECINSALDQTHQPAQLIIIDDGADLKREDLPHGTKLWHSPWQLGVAAAFNVGVGLSTTNCIFMLGSDDTLEEQCLAACADKYERTDRRDLSYFWTGVRYSDGREDQYLPCHAAMVTQTLWHHCGGFPPESASGAPDAALISILLGNKDAGDLVCVNPHMPLYNYRVHDDTDTARRAEWQGVILSTRDILTRTWNAKHYTFNLQPSNVR